MNHPIIRPNPQLDLVLERIVDVPRELVWMAWTTPEHLNKWFTPAPWTTVDCEIDLRPGGVFRTVMRSPEGQTFPNVGCYLEIMPNETLLFTSALGPGYRPVVGAGTPSNPLLFTALISLEAQGNHTKYTALVIHGDEQSRKLHEDMGFHYGWGAALDQLVASVKGM
jgi:uncharacterized protein YndB with AHSA1/START domain